MDHLAFLDALCTREPMTHREIAAVLGLSFQRVQQIEQEALAKVLAVFEGREIPRRRPYRSPAECAKARVARDAERAKAKAARAARDAERAKAKAARARCGGHDQAVDAILDAIVRQRAG